MKKVGIVGATGYTGEELMRVLTRHPYVELAFASEIEPGQKLGNVFPHLPKFKDLILCSTQNAINQQVDLVFLCLPAGESATLAKVFINRKVKVIDLGADFRFNDPLEYKRWYGIDHPEPELLRQAAYGLPEWNRNAIKTSQIVGNPGCYPTSVLLPLIPLLRKGIIADSQIFVDAKSGVSGAGKLPNQNTHFVEVNESISAYKVGRVHRHVGEMDQELSKHADREIRVVFTPHLVPMSRGILTSIYCKLKKKLDKKDLLKILNNAYKDELFVRVLNDNLPTTKMVAHSNFCFIGVETVTDSDYAVIFSAIDNLAKGASWQAVQNMNLMLDFPEQMGLL